MHASMRAHVRVCVRESLCACGKAPLENRLYVSEWLLCAPGMPREYWQYRGTHPQMYRLGYRELPCEKP
jgi:hypothetical protein